MNEGHLTDLMVLVLNKLAETKAREEIVIKCFAQFVAGLTKVPWEPMFDDLRDQAQEAAVVYRDQFLNEWLALQERRQKRPPDREG